MQRPQLRHCGARLRTAGAVIVGVCGSSLLAVGIAQVHAAQSEKAATGLTIVVLEGEGGVNIVRQKTAVVPLVEVRDRNDQPVAGAIVTFTVRSGRVVFNGSRTLMVTTNAAGRAAAAGLTPTGSGAVQIGASTTFQGQTAAATIAQTNVLTAAEAAAASGSSAAAGGSAAGAGGGLSHGALLGIIGGAAAGTAGVALKLKAGEGAATAPGSQVATLNLTGTWSGRMSDSSGGPDQATMTVTQTGASISGTVTGMTLSGSVLFNGTVTGTLSGTTLTMSASVPRGGVVGEPNCTITVNGSAVGVTATAMSGSYSGIHSCNGAFTNGQLSLTKR